jgi:hypothetical protein
MKEPLVLAERWRVHYNTIRPHSSLSFRPPAPAAWLTSTNKGHGKVESKRRLPLSQTSNYGGETNLSPRCTNS